MKKNQYTGRWTKKDNKILKANYKTMSYSELAKLLNRSHSAVCTRIFMMGLSASRLWSEEEEKKLKKLYLTKNSTEISKILGKSNSSIKNKLNKLGLKLPNEILVQRRKDSCFQPGHVPANKGTKGLMKANRTTFRPGNIPGNAKYDGCITIRRGHKNRNDKPYKYIRISLGVWQPLHEVIWERSHGPIPKGHVVRFKDKDTMNCDIDNLCLVSRHENLLINTENRTSDGFIAAGMARYDPILRAELKKRPDIIELQRLKIKLNKEIKNANRRKAE
jgi:hypothetical protein